MNEKMAFCSSQPRAQLRLRGPPSLQLKSSSNMDSLLFPTEDILPSSTLISMESGVVSQGNIEPAGVYEAVLPSTETFIGMALIVVLCAATAFVWQNQVVPTARTNLAISKSRGPVKDYLQELKDSDPNRQTDEAATVIDSTSGEDPNQEQSSMQNDEPISEAQPRTEENRALERWLFTDWLLDNKSARKAGRQKEAALPILKDAKWNSGDNPVLAATLLIGLGVLFTAVTERVASIGST